MNTEKKFEINPKNKYTLKNQKILVQPPIDVMIDGTIVDYRKNPVN